MAIRLKTLFLAFAISLISLPAWAQDSRPMTLQDAVNGYESSAHQTFQGVATDWSTNHVVYSRPEPGSDAENAVHQDPRYWMQQIRRSRPEADEVEAADVSADADARHGRKAKKKKHKRGTLIGDWSENLDTGASVGEAMFPAKFTFSQIGAPACASPGPPDFVVYNTKVAGAASVTSTGNVVFSRSSIGTETITVGGTTYTWVTGAPGAANQIRVGTDHPTNAGNLQAALSATTTHCSTTPCFGPGTVANASVTAVIDGGNTSQVDLTAKVAGTLGNFALTSSNETDQTTSITATGSNGATIAAFDNLYSSCTAPVPTPYWAYNTGTGATVPVSPVLSLDGSQVAFIQRTSGGVASLVLLKWTAGSTTSLAATLPNTASSASNYNTLTSCAKPCMFSLSLGSNDDTTSAPFMDYTNDALYVGVSNGTLYKFSPVFKGVPALATGFPTTTTNGPLASPVYDPGSSQVFVGVASGTNIGKFERFSAASGGAATAISGTLAATIGIKDAPLIDPTAGELYVFSADNGANSEVFQLSTGFLAGAVPTNGGGVGNNAIAIGALSTSIPVFAGAFDNIYFTSANGASPSGNLYVCGNAGGNATLYRIPISSNVMGTVVSIDALTTATARCSDITEFFNSPTDRIFLSVEASAVTAGNINCGTPAGGCIMAFNTTTALAVNALTTGHVLQTGGTSGIVVDNASSVGGASQVYFTPLANQACTTLGGTGGCAIQASQSGLN